MSEENVQAEDSKQQEEEVLETSNEATEEETSTEDVEEVKTRLAKAEELANNYKIRAEKAEKLAKAVKVGEVSKPSSELTTKDIYALMEAKVPESDIEDVQEYATLKKISVAEALKSNVIKTILSDKAEQRNTALASNTGSSKRSSGKVSDDVLVSKAQKGEMPESPEEIKRLWEIRKGIRK